MSAMTTREHIVEAADELFYRHGFEHTSFSHIAGAVKISRGNFYYHFKTKDEILEAVIKRRLANTRDMLAAWERNSDDPAGRIGCFIKILITNGRRIRQFGCPVGTLSTELTKLEHPSGEGATALFSLFRDWLAGQFTLLGRKSDADELAIHLLVRSQGVATLASAFGDEKFIQLEVDQMIDWLQSLHMSTAGGTEEKK